MTFKIGDRVKTNSYYESKKPNGIGEVIRITEYDGLVVVFREWNGGHDDSGMSETSKNFPNSHWCYSGSDVKRCLKLATIDNWRDIL